MDGCQILLAYVVLGIVGSATPDVNDLEEDGTKMLWIYLFDL